MAAPCEGGPWVVDDVQVDEHDDAVELTVIVTNDVEAERPAQAHLRALLGERPILDTRMGRLVRPTPPPAGVDAQPVPWSSAEVVGVSLVVHWRSAGFMAFAGVDVEPRGSEAVVTVREWHAGGILGRVDHVAVVPAPALTSKTRLLDGAH